MKKVTQKVVVLKGETDSHKIKAWGVILRVSNETIDEGWLVKEIVDEFLICLN